VVLYWLQPARPPASRSHPAGKKQSEYIRALVPMFTGTLCPGKCPGRYSRKPFVYVLFGPHACPGAHWMPSTSGLFLWPRHARTSAWIVRVSDTTVRYWSRIVTPCRTCVISLRAAGINLISDDRCTATSCSYIVLYIVARPALSSIVSTSLAWLHPLECAPENTCVPFCWSGPRDRPGPSSDRGRLE
jgi:hypothetical protein